ncbi:hypothetical protein D3C76_515820 [compost metagenome]
MEKNEYIVVWSYIVIVLDETLDLYEEWDKFQRFGIAREEADDERKEIFIELLVREGKLGIPDDEEVIPEKKARYFDWKIRATAEDMNMLRAALPPEVFDKMSSYEREMFATGYHQPIFKKAHFSRATFVMWLSDQSVGTMENKKMTIFRSYMEDQREKATKAQGFAIQNVLPGKVDPYYSYTIGLTEKLGFDLVLVNGGPSSGEIVATQASRLLAEKARPPITLDANGSNVVPIVQPMPQIGEVFALPGFTIGKDKIPVRARIVEIALDSITAQGMNGALNKGMKKVMQLQIGDENNVLPGEPDYNSGFVQELTEKPDKGEE